MEGSIPTPNGDIHVYMDKEKIRIKATEGSGYVTFTSRNNPKANIGQIESLGESKYRLWIDTKNEIIIEY